MKTSFVRLCALVTVAPALLVSQSATSDAVPPRGTVPAVSLPLRTGTPWTLCLTDASQRALSDAGMELQAVAPVVLVTENGHRCLRWTVDGGGVDNELSAATMDAAGGFALVRGDRRAEFTDLHGTYTIGDDRAHASTVHHGDRIDTLTTPGNDVVISASGVDIHDAPSLLTQAAAAAVTADIPNSPLRLDDHLFDVDLRVGVLPAAVPVSPRVVAGRERT
ncbi:hypothetical protein [Embleya sp. AB8]|uniref:hypothetical protein n=1 Tax=Embleya sp. AB8 TaxID=3156304 RepID=UPI003C788C3F